MGSAAQPRSGSAPKEAAATAAPAFFRNLRRLLLAMTDGLSFFILFPHAAGADRQIGCSCFVAPHKITPCAKCKAYQGQGAMRWQAKACGATWSVQSAIAGLLRCLRKQEKPPTSARGGGFPSTWHRRETLLRAA